MDLGNPSAERHSELELANLAESLPSKTEPQTARPDKTKPIPSDIIFAQLRTTELSLPNLPLFTPPLPEVVTHEVSKKDTWSTVFERYRLDQALAKNVLQAIQDLSKSDKTITTKLKVGTEIRRVGPIYNAPSAARRQTASRTGVTEPSKDCARFRKDRLCPGANAPVSSNRRNFL